jgi:hypothetical protein
MRELLKRLTISQDVSIVFIIASLILPTRLFEVFPEISFFTFALGFVYAIPLSVWIWQIMIENWKKVYKPFFGKKRLTNKLIEKHWHLIWWMIPYCVINYSVLTAVVSEFFSTHFVILLFYGSLLGIFGVSYFYQGKYHRMLKSV